MISLTKRQFEALLFIKKYYEQNNFVPSIREIGEALTINFSGAARLKNGLISRGALIPGKHSTARSYLIADNIDSNLAKLKILQKTVNEFISAQKAFYKAYENNEETEKLGAEVRYVFNLLCKQNGEIE
tara:strand:- start:790 stop:1176 length:387 start_codon:yes stop_codon:yes gene_type:complete